MALWSSDGNRVVEAGVGAQAWARHQELLTQTPEAAYLRDRARRVSGVVRTLKHEPLDATVDVVDARSLALAIQAESPALDRAGIEIPVEAQASATNGSFTFHHLPLGPKFLFAYAEGHAPLRRPNVAVEDGVPVAGVELDVSPARHGALVNDLPTPLVVRPLYFGWWSRSSWLELAPGAETALEWRDPDGWPWAVALRNEEGALELRTLDAPDEGGAPCWALSSAGPFSNGGRPARQGDVAQVDSVRDALAQPQAPGAPAGGTGTVFVTAEAGWCGVDLHLVNGDVLTAFTDAYGEVIFRGVPPGSHWSDATFSLGGRTLPRPASVLPGGTATVRFTRADRSSTRAREACFVVGTVLSGGTPVPDAVVFLQPVSPRSAVLPRVVEVDEDGTYRVDDLRAGQAAVLLAAHGGELGDVRHSLLVAPDGSTPVLAIDLELPNTRFAVPRAEASDIESTLYVLASGDDSGIPRWTCPWPETGPLEIRGLEPGDYVLEARDGGRVLARSEPVRVPLPTGPTAQIEVDWRPARQETRPPIQR